MMRCVLLCSVLAACHSETSRLCASRPDVVDPCGGVDGGIGAAPGTPDEGAVPSGRVDANGGKVDRLWFATTGDTRPAECDQTNAYPKAAIARIAASMKALRVQFTIDLGDHMYVCNQSDPEARQQMGFYMDATAQGPPTWWMTMGNHECGSGAYPYACFVGGPHDANFAAFMAALGRPLPYYANDVQTSLGLARFVVIADDSWNAAQAAWLKETLSDADRRAKYTIIARHHPVQGTRTGAPEILNILSQHKYALILTAHNHEYQHDTRTWQGRSAVVGLGGAGGKWGFGTVLQSSEGLLVFVQRDANGNPIGAPWQVGPQ
jgi:hypothetical protein